uniref:4nitrophenylphosphatase putative n=1 Tax=Albugo laibachii Nc14 TaxID=890382 RepID=F0W5T1_9STRA|nr:4nitrophenylphosphatase putative [Albugo laibachii Nc14]|eukprot:CCA16472.1 4nitrophenylphosphatase putative [Albugo laibachii Nc14]
MSFPLTQEKWRHLRDEMDCFMLDCDGVLWRGDESIPGASQAVQTLQNLQKKVLFVTNNSTKNRQSILKNLEANGIKAVKEDIISSSFATAYHLEKIAKLSGKVYVVGESGLIDDLKDAGFECLGSKDGLVHEFPKPFSVDTDIKAVVVGLDRNISYYKLAYAATCLRTIPNCLFIATNLDPTYPVDDAFLPGGGSVVKFMETAIGRPPDAVIGKPSQDFLKRIVEMHSLQIAKTCMIGDRLSTDIEFGRVGGLQTLLVLSGVTAESELDSSLKPEQTPHHYATSIAVISEFENHKKPRTSS